MRRLGRAMVLAYALLACLCAIAGDKQAVAQQGHWASPNGRYRTAAESPSAWSRNEPAVNRSNDTIPASPLRTYQRLGSDGVAEVKLMDRQGETSLRGSEHGGMVTLAGYEVDAGNSDAHLDGTNPQAGQDRESESVAASRSQLHSFSAQAAELSYTPPGVPEAPDFGALLLRLVVGTSLAIVACITVLWLARRGGLRVGRAAHGQGDIRVVDSLGLPNRCFLYIVDVRERQFIVSCDTSGLKSVVPLSDSFSADLALAEQQVDHVDQVEDRGSFGKISG